MTARIRLSLAGCFLALSLPVMASPAGHFDFGQPAPAASADPAASAFAGYQNMRAAYRHAIAQRYRFFSYGDAMLLQRV